jgi:PAS domain S-box-containing protein
LLVAATHLDAEEGVKFIIDIGEQKRAEEALRESEERFRQFAENSADVFWILNARTLRLEYVNPVYEEMFGQSREKLLRDRNKRLEVVHPDDRKVATSGLSHALAGETFVRNYRVLRPTDGSLRYIRDTGFPIRNESGDIHRVAGVARDVTQDMTRTEALAESEERFRLLVEGARDYAIFLINPENQISYWSAGAERIFGWSAEEAIGKSGILIFTPEDRAINREQEELEIAMREGCANDRRWHIRKDGTRIWVDGIMRRLDDEQGKLRGFAKVARDATEQRLADEELRKSREELEQRVKERTAELSLINRNLEKEIAARSRLEQEILLISEREKRRIGQDLHDSLCQELAATAFLLESHAQKLKKDHPAQAKTLSESAQTVNSNVGLARDLAQGLHPVELSTSGLTNALRDLAFRTSEGSKVTCRFDCPKPVRILDDTVALNLFRIAQEAITNALKHAKAQSIVISLKRTGRALILTITNDGEGPPAKRTRGGMGINIMQHRANVLGAELTMGSRRSGGTIVTCKLVRH